MANSYYDVEALSQSMGKALMTGIGTYKKKEREGFLEDPEHFILGNGVDCKLSTPQDFDTQFYISPLEKKPSEVVMNILRRAYYIYTSIDTSDTELVLSENLEIIHECINYYEYYMNREKTFEVELELIPEKGGRIYDIRKKGLPYWKELLKSENRTILSVEEKGIVDTISETLITHEHTRKYFEQRDRKIILYQLPIYWNYKNVACKALLDMVIVDLEKKTIQPIDIKTIGNSTKAFPRSVMQRRYDIQASWYTFALHYWKKNILEYNLSKFDLSEFQILDFKFIVDSTTSPGLCPLVWILPKESSHLARYGYTKNRGNITDGLNYQKHYICESVHPGWEQMVDDYKWYQEHGFEMDRKIVESKGELKLELW